MGVPVKKDEVAKAGGFVASWPVAGGMGSPDRSKKRKR
jgi:hypothetical protein